MAKRFLVLIALLTLGFFVAGCSEGDESASVVNPNPDVFAPTGSISGVVVDMCNSSNPVEGAVVSVAYAGKVRQVTTKANGQFAFDNVPVNWVGELIEADQGYYVVCDLSDKTGFGYSIVEEVWVAAGYLLDGTNMAYADEFTESGSGAATPVNKLGNGVIFEVGPLNSSISGNVYDLSMAPTAPNAPGAGTAATVSLYYGSVLAAAPQTTTTGAFSFTGIPPAYDGYYLVVDKPGYKYADGEKVSCGGSCGWLAIECAVPCNSGLSGVVVGLTPDPLRDMTVPYIVQADAGAETDVISDDHFADLVPADIDEIVFTFSEAMKVSRSLKYNAVNVYADITVLVTSNGASTTAATAEATVSLKDFSVSMTSAGVMTITPDYYSDEEILDIANPFGGTAEVVEFVRARYHVDINASAHLTDANLVPWYPYLEDLPATDGQGYFHALNEMYQNYFILEDGDFIFSIGEYPMPMPMP
ncbi:MAG TPA: carboxypeptidase-like regulatory domain-containing protein [Deltaproteobacteria bacterium]|nr:carboxypeptidase-like regulatory domain-containing protein [Deltaproteobacteria bacterium]